MEEKIVTKLIKQGHIMPEDKEIYLYGLRQLSMTLLNIVTTILIGLLWGLWWQSLVFLVLYIPLRRYAGGFHARTPFRCYCYSVLLIVATLWCIKLEFFNSTNHCILAIILAAGIIVSFSPVADANKPLSHLERKVYANRTRSILFGEIICFSLTCLLGLQAVKLCIAVAVLSAAMMVGIGHIAFKRL